MFLTLQTVTALRIMSPGMLTPLAIVTIATQIVTSKSCTKKFFLFEKWSIKKWFYFDFRDKNSQIQASSHFNDLLQCPHHRDVVMSLSSVLQVITLECPTALVWNCVGEGRSTHPLNNSPLDHLSCPPSALPMPIRASNAIFRQQIKTAEETIKTRSRAAEVRWSCDKWQQSSDGQTTAKVLNALDALDRHSFDKTDPSNNLDSLYSKIFTTPVAKDGPQGEIRIENVSHSLFVKK